MALDAPQAACVVEALMGAPRPPVNPEMAELIARRATP